MEFSSSFHSNFDVATVKELVAQSIDISGGTQTVISFDLAIDLSLHILCVWFFSVLSICVSLRDRVKDESAKLQHTESTGAKTWRVGV